MGISRPFTTWMCDRCGVAETLPDRDQPKGWLGVYLVTPPRRDVNDERMVWLLCKACDSSLAAWKREADPDPAAGTNLLEEDPPGESAIEYHARMKDEGKE